MNIEKERKAIERLRAFEPKTEPYYLAWCNTNDLRKHKRYLGDCDDSYDNTYCDLYFDIGDIKLEDYVDFED